VSEVLMIAVTALGDLAGRTATTRPGARAGDTVAIAGEVGLSARGLGARFGRFRGGEAPVPVGDALLGQGERPSVVAQLRPPPPIGLGAVAAAAGATAMMDVSDGLALDARRMASASDVTIDFESHALGDDPARALAGGEDHALLATFPPGVLPSGFRAIGAVGERGEEGVLCDGEVVDAAGWDPYRDWDAAAG